jgi:hypothetical protein
MAVVMTTTSSAAVYLLAGHYATWTTQMAKSTPDQTLLFNTALQSFLIFAMLLCTVLIIASGVARILKGARHPAGFPVPVG